MIRGSRAAIVLAVILAASRPAAPVAADEFSDFRIPDHRLFSWTGSLSSGLQDLRGSDPGNPYSNSDNNATGSSDLLWFHDSDASQTQLAVQARSAGFARRSRSEPTTLYSGGSVRVFDQQRNSAAEEGWSLSLGRRDYPWRVPVGYQLSLAGGGSYSQSWLHHAHEQYFTDTNGVNHEHQLQQSVDWTYGYRANASLRIGYGRVRDATGVFEVRVFEERLRRARVLSRELSPRARQQLVDIAYTVGDMRQVRDRPAKSLWQAVEAVLREDGALADSVIGVVGAERAREPFIGAARGAAGFPFAASPVARMAGSFVGFLARGEHRSDIDRRNGHFESAFSHNDSTLFERASSSFARNQGAADDVLAGSRIEYYRPLGLRWQFDATNEIAFPLRRHRDGFSTQSEVRLVAVVADRWVGEGYGNHQRVILRHGGPGAPVDLDYWSVGYGASLTRYVEDRLEFQVDLSEKQERRHAQSSFQSSFLARCRLTYRLAGRHSGPQYLTQ